MFATDHHHTLNDDHALSDQQVETIADIEPSYEERASPSSNYNRSKSISPVASSHASSPPPTKSIDSKPSRSTSSKQRPKPRKVIGNYTLVSTLGSGSMGKVKLAMHNITQEKVRSTRVLCIYPSTSCMYLIQYSFYSSLSRLYLGHLPMKRQVPRIRMRIERLEPYAKQASCYYCIIHTLSVSRKW